MQKAWPRTKGKAVLLTPHYDVLEWVEPDWVFDTASRTFDRRCLQRPTFDLEIWQTDWRYWPAFKPHYYLDLPKMIAADVYVGTVEGELVCHLGVSPAFHQGGFHPPFNPPAGGRSGFGPDGPPSSPGRV